MLWLALHLPLLALESFSATLPDGDRQRPLVLVVEHRITAVNAAAAHAGIQPGLKRATALALASDLLQAEADPARDAAALLAVAHAALAFTPAVTLHDTQTVLLDVRASLRCFGGLAALQQRLRAALAPLGHRVQLAAAPTALAAALLARWWPAGRGDMALGAHATQLPALQALLAEVPVRLLCAPWNRQADSAPQGGVRPLGRPGGSHGPGREHWDALQGMGLQTLSDLRQLPRAGLARRFGEALLDDIDRAFGLQPDPRRWLALPEVFDSRLELFARADTTDQVLHAGSVLLARLVAWAQARGARVAAFTLQMRHEPQRHATTAEATDLLVQLAEPALDPAHLQLLLRERLAHCQLAAPTLELRLVCRHLVQAGAPNGELFPTRASDNEGLARLLERLRARLGDTQVLRLQPVADHRPEQASRTVPAQGRGADGVRGPAWAAAAGVLAASSAVGRVLPLHRPAWLLPDPQPLAQRDALPLLAGRPLQLLSGPERIEAGWWDSAPAARDYFIAQASDGALVWVWRSRLPTAPTAAAEVSWFLQGLFA